MKRCIDIGTQMYLDDEEYDEFCFYCTIADEFEKFNGCSTWRSANGFAYDFVMTWEFKTPVQEELKRYMSLIPDKFHIDENGNRELDDSFEKQLIDMMITTIKQLYIDVYA